jgi:hypothetical protein
VFRAKWGNFKRHQCVFACALLSLKTIGGLVRIERLRGYIGDVWNEKFLFFVCCKVDV